uniref:Anomalous homeobox protein isoform X2 n=1 Tax=Pogona vitticeps TaxID=103695 RepID=A0ABM5F2M2_9SAUR
MARTRGCAAARQMKPFLALLKRSDRQEAPPLRLVGMAGRLCQGLRQSPRGLKKLVEAMEQGRHWRRFLASLPVVQAGVAVRLQEKEFSAACHLLESCTVMEKEELLKLWNEIHYRQAMERRHARSLTPVQKYRCRKSPPCPPTAPPPSVLCRNPPPASLCPARAKSRYYSQDVRAILRRFAVEVTTHPSKKQREGLACETNLEPHRIYNWFANYRRRQGRKPKSREPGFPLGFEDKAASPRGCPGARIWQDGPATGQGERPLPTCKKEQRGHGHLSEGGFLRPTSFGQSEALGAPGPRAVSVGPLETIWESAAPDAGQAEAKPEADPNAVRDPAGPWPASLGAQKPLRPPSGSSATGPSSQSPPHGPWTRPGTAHKGIQCTLWSRAAACRCPCSCSRGSLNAREGGAAAAAGTGTACGERSLGLLAGGPPRTGGERADIEVEGLVRREQEQLAASQPFSSSQGDADQAQLHPATSRPRPEGSPALTSEQRWTFPGEEPAVVLREAMSHQGGRLTEERRPMALCRRTFQELQDPESQPSFTDTLWAASLLCEFSSGSRP